MARPQKEENEKLEKVASFRLTVTDYDAYKKKFAASGLTQSEFFRECVLENRTQVIAKPIASLEKKRMLFLMNKISNNINQMAHRANSEAQAGVIKESTYMAFLDELSLMNAYLKKVIGNVD